MMKEPVPSDMAVWGVLGLTRWKCVGRRCDAEGDTGGDAARGGWMPIAKLYDFNRTICLGFVDPIVDLITKPRRQGSRDVSGGRFEIWPY